MAIKNHKGDKEMKQESCPEEDDTGAGVHRLCWMNKKQES